MRNTYPTSNDAARMTDAAWNAAESCDLEAMEKFERDHEQEVDDEEMGDLCHED